MSPISIQEPDGRFDRQEHRLEWLMLIGLPYVLLATSTLITALAGAWSAPPGGTLALVGLTAVWLGWMVVLFPKRTRRRVWLVVYTVGVLALIAALVTRSPLFSIFAFIGYIHVWEFLPGRWRYAGMTVAAMLHVSAIFGGPQTLTAADLPVYLIIVVVVTVMSSGFSQFGENAFKQRDQQRALAGDLAEANRRLEATLAENEGLHAQLVTQAREAGVLDERQRIAREIHDTIAQGLTGIVTQVQAARNAAGRPDDWHRHLDNAARLARDSLTEARRSVQAVGPEALETARLPEALTDVATRWSGISGVQVEVATTGTARPLHPEVEVTLLRAAQEALANVARHAAASRVGVTLSYMEDVVTLDVLDDGVGFDAARLGGGVNGNGTRRDGGFGLTAMRQRVSRLAGTLEIESEAGEGTVVSASVPAVPRGGQNPVGQEPVGRDRGGQDPDGREMEGQDA